MVKLSSRHRRTVARIYEEPTRSDLPFRDWDALIRALGAEVVERSGSRVAFILGERIGHFHRPHPRPDARQAAVRQMCEFLREAGIEPEPSMEVQDDRVQGLYDGSDRD